MTDTNPYADSIKPNTDWGGLTNDGVADISPPGEDATMLYEYDAFTNAICDILYGLVNPQFTEESQITVANDLAVALGHVLNSRRQYIEAGGGRSFVGRGDTIRGDDLDFLRLYYSKSPFRV